MNYEPAAYLFIGVMFGALGGIAIGLIYGVNTLWNFLVQDPDGPGGWQSRLEQLGQRHRMPTDEESRKTKP